MRTSALLLTGVLLAPTPSRASCHFMEIVEVFAGTDAEPNAHYVVLRMTADLQGSVMGNVITTSAGTFATFAGNVTTNTASGSKILVATAEAATLLGLAADQTATGTLDFPGGTVTHDCSADSVAYGSGPIPELVRGCALKKSGATWSLGEPEPANNAGATAPLTTCVAPDGGFPEPAAELDMGGVDLGNPEPDGGGSQTEEDDGCGCRIGGRSQSAWGWVAMLALVAVAHRRRR